MLVQTGAVHLESLRIRRIYNVIVRGGSPVRLPNNYNNDQSYDRSGDLPLRRFNNRPPQNVASRHCRLDGTTLVIDHQRHRRLHGAIEGRGLRRLRRGGTVLALGCGTLCLPRLP